MKTIRLIAVSFLLLSLASSLCAKQLSDKLTLNFTERFRLTSWDNAISLDEYAHASRTFTRHRTQLGAIWTPRPVISLALQLGNEFRYHLVPETIDFDFDEFFIDNLYVKLNNPAELPLTLTVGRQNIILGEGFIVMEGHPLDGSRSIYFDAVRLDWTIAPAHTLTAFVSNVQTVDDRLPIVHEQDQALVEQPETGAGLYYVGKLNKAEVHGYVVWKEDDVTRYRQETKFTTVGSRLKCTLTDARTDPRAFGTLDVVAEGAYQYCKRSEDISGAFGGYAYGELSPNWKRPCFLLPKMFRLGMIYLSGDNPDTEEHEGWDPMFARWPKWSESYIYTQTREDGVAWWTNLISLNAAVVFGLGQGVDLRLDYHHLTAPHELEPYRFHDLSGGGTKRGDLYIGKLTYTFNERWAGHLLWEGFKPGDYYFDGADSYAWIRAELMFRY